MRAVVIVHPGKVGVRTTAQRRLATLAASGMSGMSGALHLRVPASRGGGR